MTACSPNVNIENLKKFVADEITPKYPTRSPIKGNKGSKAVARPKPRVLSVDDIVWGGEQVRTFLVLLVIVLIRPSQMILLTFDPATVPLGPRSLLAKFPSGRPKFKTQTFVRCGLMNTSYFPTDWLFAGRHVLCSPSKGQPSCSQDIWLFRLF